MTSTEILREVVKSGTTFFGYRNKILDDAGIYDRVVKGYGFTPGAERVLFTSDFVTMLWAVLMLRLNTSGPCLSALQSLQRRQDKAVYFLARSALSDYWRSPSFIPELYTAVNATARTMCVGLPAVNWPERKVVATLLLYHLESRGCLDTGESNAFDVQTYGRIPITELEKVWTPYFAQRAEERKQFQHLKVV